MKGQFLAAFLISTLVFSGATAEEAGDFGEPVSAGVQDVYTSDERIAPLGIVTPGGETNYYVKVVEADTGAPVLTAYIPAGEALDIDVPLGTFRVRYAMGKVWHGASSLFGEETYYAEADATLEFKVNNDRVSGYTIELIKQEGGNLETKLLSGAQF